MEQLHSEIHTILCRYSYHNLYKGSTNKNKFGEISSHQVMGVIPKSVRYGKYTKINMVLFLQLIG